MLENGMKRSGFGWSWRVKDREIQGSSRSTQYFCNIITINGLYSLLLPCESVSNWQYKRIRMHWMCGRKHRPLPPQPPPLKRFVDSFTVINIEFRKFKISVHFSFWNVFAAENVSRPSISFPDQQLVNSEGNVAAAFHNGPFCSLGA